MDAYDSSARNRQILGFLGSQSSLFGKFQVI